MQISTRKKPTCRLGRALETESASLPRFQSGKADTGCAQNDGVRPAAAAPNVVESHDIQRSLQPSEASTTRRSISSRNFRLGSSSRGEWKTCRGTYSTRYPRAVPWKYLRIVRRHVQSSLATSSQVAAAKVGSPFCYGYTRFDRLRFLDQNSTINIQLVYSFAILTILSSVNLSQL